MKRQRVLGILVLASALILSWSTVAFADDFYVISSSKKNYAQVEKTGQTTSYDTGDDGDLQKGIEWPDPRFTDNGDGTVTDNLTGLMWLKNANCIEINYPGFDNDNIAGDGAVTWQHALTFVAGINDGTYSDCSGGYTDWRLPNIKELQSLIDYSNYDPALPSDHLFDNVVSSNYWSSTTYAASTGMVWLVHFFSSYGGNGNKTNDYFVWPVRGGN